MSVRRTQEVEEIRKTLNLKLSVRTHRCTWCDLIKEVKETRKHKAKEELSAGTFCIPIEDGGIQKNIRREPNDNVVGLNATAHATY